MAHIVEIWEMRGDDGTLWTPACLSCGWVGTDGPRAAAVVAAARHEADESAGAATVRPAGGIPRSLDRRRPPAAG